jgi:hypothetical protein
MDAPFGFLHHLHSAAHENLEVECLNFSKYFVLNVNILKQGFFDVPCQVGAQGETYRQAVAAMDVSDSVGDAHLFGNLDPECAAHWRGYLRQLGPPIQAVYLQLVGP